MHIYTSEELEKCPLCGSPAKVIEDSLWDIHCTKEVCIFHDQRFTKRGWDEVCELVNGLREENAVLKERIEQFQGDEEVSFSIELCREHGCKYAEDDPCDGEEYEGCVVHTWEEEA